MSNKLPRTKVGIFMPAYNQGPYIHDALESLKKQTFQDFHVAIVDDASTDGVTIDILEQITYEKATLFLNDTNRGVNKLAREYLPVLNSEYILVLCADDIIYPTYLEETVNYLDSHKDVAAVCTWLEYFQDMEGERRYDPKKCKLPEMLVENHFCGSALVRREAYEAIGWSSTEKDLRIHNDYHRWVSMLEKGYELGIITKPLFKYRILHNSLSHGASAETELTFKKAFFKKHKELYQKHYDYVIQEQWRAITQYQHDYREYSKGHEWLDTEYKKILTEKEDRDKRIEELVDQTHSLNREKAHLLAYKKYSFYPLLRSIKNLFRR